ncbi:MAG: Nuclear control of ATPase protein 2 [Trichoglossum hirsutum]|nr:MAG: Nuclear control of ATPase protein 2 [Trichoglossum hirsutum]
MSLVVDLVRRVDLQLDRLQLSTSVSLPSSRIPGSQSRFEDVSSAGIEQASVASESPRIFELQRLIKLLSTSSSSPLLKATRVERILEQARFSESTPDGALSNYEVELEWLLVSKATVQTYGLILTTLLKQNLPLSDDVWYWDDVLGSYSYTALYSIQTSPLRLWYWSSGVYQNARRRLSYQQKERRHPSLEAAIDKTSRSSRPLTERWKQFYDLVKDSMRDRSIADVQRRVISPFAFSRTEASRRRAGLKKLREMSATGLGILMNESLRFDEDDEESIIARGDWAGVSAVNYQEEWRNIIEKSIAIMETVLQKVTSLDIGVTVFEDTVFASLENNSEPVGQGPFPDTTTSISKSAILSKRLRQILQVHIPSHIASSKSLANEYGRPSRLVRYWLPVVLLLLSSSTILRVLVGRKEAITVWIRELGRTTLDFWTNWVVDPIRKVIGTIHHDEDSELALMSRRSLEGDRESLERMVVDYAVDHSSLATEDGITKPTGQLSEAEITDIKNKVREGDLTPVLVAYERELRSPFMGAIRGDLVRTLLIQIQKTKVDVEVAVGGIDALLKSQELVFGFVGLTPGILVCLGVFRWMNKILGIRRGLAKGKHQGIMLRVLRNIDRTLMTASSSNNAILSYKEHGLLLCEVDLLRKLAKQMMPSEIHREFIEEVDDLIDIRTGVGKQLRVIERIRWAFAKWLD